jgi:phosphopantetheinyl transferase
MPENSVYFMLSDVPDRARQSPVGRKQLAQLAAALSGLPEQEFCIAAEPSGRLLLTTTHQSAPSIFISMSHCGPKLACAATMIGPIGIDIERARPGRNLAGISEAAFGPAERQRCAQADAAGFYRIWTLREAMAKALGVGLVMVGDRVDRAAEGPDEGSWQWQDWHLTHFRLPIEMHLALAVRPRHAVLGDIDWREITLPAA